jgi:hypothetical protein
MTTDAIFDSLLAQPDVEFAVLNTLETWLPTMLGVIERRHSLPAGTLRKPPGRDSYIGGIDHESWTQDLCPMVIAVVNPTGNAERVATGYGQWFEIEVSTTHIEDTEDEARVMAGRVGTAVMGALVQNGSLGGVASRTELVSSPTVELADPDQRRVVRSLTIFHAFVDGLANENAGTNTPTPTGSPQYPGTPDAPFADWPVVVTPSVTLVAEPPQ